MNYLLFTRQKVTFTHFNKRFYKPTFKNIDTQLRPQNWTNETKRPMTKV